MNCRLVFFAARKTSFCERAEKILFRAWPWTRQNLLCNRFRTTRNELTDAFKNWMWFRCRRTRIWRWKGNKSIISRALCETPVNDCKKLKMKTAMTDMLSEPQIRFLFFCPMNPSRLNPLCRDRSEKYIMANSVMQWALRIESWKNWKCKITVGGVPPLSIREDS